MAKKLTKRQAKEFARIQSGLLIYNTSGTEFEGSDLTDDEVDMCYEFMNKHHERLLKDNEHQLSNTQVILNYVRRHF